MAIRLYWHGLYQILGDGVASEYTFDLRVVTPQVDFEGSILPKDKPDHLYNVQVSGSFADPETGIVPIVSASINGWELTIVFVNALPAYVVTSGNFAQVSVILGYNG